MSQIIMPQAGQAMENGTIVRWHKVEGEAIAKGEVLFEVETDTALIEVEASEAGVLGKILVPAGKTAPVKTAVAELLKAGEAAVSATPQAQPAAQPVAPAALPEGVKVILMPKAGQSVEEGTLVKWRVKPGDIIKNGQVIFEVETDKSVIEVESTEDGRLARIVAGEGAIVPVLQPVAYIADNDAAVDAYLAAGTASPAQASSDIPQSAIRNPQSASVPEGVKVILMPKAGQSVEEETLVKWRVQPGAMIKTGDVIFEVETDKSVIEVEATEEGRLARIVVQEGQVAPVLVPVAYLADNDADVDAFIAATAAAAPAPAPAQPAPAPQFAIRNPQSSFSPSPAPVAVAEAPRPANGHGRVKASPAARKLATERGLDLAAVGQGSGPGGRILTGDLAKAAPAVKKAPAKAAPELKPYSPVPFKSSEPVRTKMTPMRRAIARNLLASKQNIPHWYIQRVIDAGPMLAFYRAEKAKYPCSVNDVLVLAIARTIMEFPEYHSQVVGDDIIELPSVNIGIAVGLDAGLVVPVVLNVEKMDLRALGAESKRVATVARTTGKVENMGKGCFTISNLGMFGVDQFTAIINPPEAAIMAVSAVREEVIVKDGMMRPGKTLSLTLSADHRLIDGVLAAKFQARLKEMLENPEVFLA